MSAITLTASLLSHARLSRGNELERFQISRIRDPLEMAVYRIPRGWSERLGDVDGASPPAPIEDAPVADACYLDSPNAIGESGRRLFHAAFTGPGMAPAVARAPAETPPPDVVRPPSTGSRRRRVSCRRRRRARRPRRSRARTSTEWAPAHARVVPPPPRTSAPPPPGPVVGALLRHPRCSGGAPLSRRAARREPPCPTRRCPHQPSSRPWASGAPHQAHCRRAASATSRDVCREPLLHCGGGASARSAASLHTRLRASRPPSSWSTRPRSRPTEDARHLPRPDAAGCWVAGGARHLAALAGADRTTSKYSSNTALRLHHPPPGHGASPRHRHAQSSPAYSAPDPRGEPASPRSTS